MFFEINNIFEVLSFNPNLRSGRREHVKVLVPEATWHSPRRTLDSLAGPVGSQLLWDALILVPGKDDHVHAPEDAHDPAHHNDGREHLN